MSILILACLVAICLPILSVQIPRYFPSCLLLFPTSVPIQSSNGTKNGSEICGRTLSVRRYERFTEEGGRKEEDTESGEVDTGVGEGKRERQVPRQTGKEGAAAWFFSKDRVVDDDGEGEITSMAGPRPRPLQVSHTPTVSLTTPFSIQGGHSKPWITHILRFCAAILAVLLCISVFALVVAYSLAAFLVYKTEARLEEHRRGILQGGEMKLCLCAA